jgi:hypothetical protein
MRATHTRAQRTIDARRPRTRRPIAVRIDPLDPFLLEDTTWTARELQEVRTSNPMIVVRHRPSATAAGC